jgi:hypothetical protein
MELMFVYGPGDHWLIRRSLAAMSEMATDELATKDIDQIFSENVTFVLAALRGLTHESRRVLPYVSQNFSETEVSRLIELLSEIEVARSPQPLDLTGKVILTEEEVASVISERYELAKKERELTARIAKLTESLVRSGETKLRETTHVKTWYYDGEYTHGINGLASVTDERTENLVGIGPDFEYVGTADELVAYLRAHGYSELETDIEILRIAWDKPAGN